jgi:O-antigen/teichoic acid export membrane protein
MSLASIESLAVGIVGQGSLVLSGVLLARLLGPEQRGIAALLILWPIVVSRIGVLGVPLASAYYMARDTRSFRHILHLDWALVKRQVPTLVLCHALILAAYLSGKQINVVLAGMVTIVAVPAAVAGDFGLTMLQGQQRFRTLNLLRNVNQAVICGGLLLLVAVHRASLAAVMVIWSLALIVSSAAYLLAALNFRPAPIVEASTVSTRDLLRFGLRGLLGSMYPLETFRIDQIFVGLFLSATGLGLYVVGIAFTNLPMFIALSLAYVAFPGIAAEVNYARRRRMIWQFFWLLMALSVAAVAVLELSIGSLIPWFFGHQFDASIGIARVALVGALFLSARRILAEGLRGAGHPAAGTMAEGVLLLVLVPTVVVGSHYLGLEGVAGGVAVAGCASLVVLIAFEARAHTLAALGLPTVSNEASV